jgi:uncharacterized protein
MSLYGVDADLLARAVDTLAAQPKVRKVVLFGSRARGDYSPGSDIDLAVSAPGLGFDEFLDLRASLSGLPLVFKMDLVHLEALPSDAPIAGKICHDGVVLYEAVRP